MEMSKILLAHCALILLPLQVIILSSSPNLFISCSVTLNEDQIISSSSPDPSSLPSWFFFGTASSAYQFEGAYLSDGKGLNNWDVYSHKPGKLVYNFLVPVAWHASEHMQI
ncbi:hypothetical protein CDL15_Pgr012967 [Punica granatum]|uniref:Uncharacterized protein n=1 Tax=Punica granatum TaxID=22663 RepID=A0A218XFI9_PUNGR|nr:hypothetical protein CDL15_Pgr012967 [Punica granatum]PKI32739.1 hypothetical protein CRG98_046875 [Punica granatum]